MESIKVKFSAGFFTGKQKYPLLDNMDNKNLTFKAGLIFLLQSLNESILHTLVTSASLIE